MSQVMRKNAAFTLIELLVVVIIVAVLAAVGIPLMAGQIARARASEAEAGLGTLRTGMRARLAEVIAFTSAPTFTQIGISVTLGVVPGGDLDGRFFDDDNYRIVGALGTSYCVDVNGAASSLAPRASQVQGSNLIQRSMDANGNIGNGLCGGTAIGGTPLN